MASPAWKGPRDAARPLQRHPLATGGPRYPARLRLRRDARADRGRPLLAGDACADPASARARRAALPVRGDLRASRAGRPAAALRRHRLVRDRKPRPPSACRARARDRQRGTLAGRAREPPRCPRRCPDREQGRLPRRALSACPRARTRAAGDRRAAALLERARAVEGKEVVNFLPEEGPTRAAHCSGFATISDARRRSTSGTTGPTKMLSASMA